MKKKFEFRDADLQRVHITIEVRKCDKQLRNRNDLSEYAETREISVTGGCARSSGQCYDSINPRTDGQKKLLQFWNEYHLNHMCGGTVKQDEYLRSEQFKKDIKRIEMDAKMYHAQFENLEYGAVEVARAIGLEWSEQINQFSSIDGNKICDLLKSLENTFKADGKGNVKLDANDYYVRKALLIARGLYIDRGYAYGTGWLYEPIPDNIEEQIDAMIEEIEAEEDALDEEQEAVFDMGAEDFKATEEYVQKVIELRYCDREEAVRFLALGQHIGCTFGCLNETFEEVRNNLYQAEGQEYYIGTDDELEAVAKEILDDGDYDELWKMAVAENQTTDSLEDWLDDVLKMDGWATILNHWDGTSNSYWVAGEYIEVCRT